jgi:hypothetical protein
MTDSLRVDVRPPVPLPDGGRGEIAVSPWSRILATGAATFSRKLRLLWAVLQLVGLLAVHGIFPYNHTMASNGDVYLYYTWSYSLWHGYMPYQAHLTMPIVYPPGILPFLALPSFSFVGYQLEFLFLALAADALVLRALLRAERRLGALAWTLASVLLGPVFWNRFDIFVAAMLVAAVLFLDHLGRSHKNLATDSLDPFVSSRPCTTTARVHRRWRRHGCGHCPAVRGFGGHERSVVCRTTAIRTRSRNRVPVCRSPLRLGSSR